MSGKCTIVHTCWWFRNPAPPFGCIKIQVSFEKNSFYFLLIWQHTFAKTFATTVWAFAEHMGKQELSRPFRGESGGAYLRPKALLFVHCKENRRRLAVRLDKKDGQTWHVPRVVPTTYCLGVGLRSLHFLRVPFLHWPYVLKGGPMDFGRGIFRATFAKLSRTFRKNSVPNPGKSKKVDKRWFCLLVRLFAVCLQMNPARTFP